LGNDQGKIQALINQELLRGNVLLNERAAAVAKVSGLTGATGLRALVSNTPFTIKDEQVVINPRQRKAAVGLIPAINEAAGAYAGGYRPGAIKELNIKGLGNVIYNTAEKVKYLPGFSQPAIIPPQSSKAGINYNKSFIQAHGFSPYKSEGLVPNFAGYITPTKNLLKLLREEGVDINRYGRSPQFIRPENNPVPTADPIL